MDVFDGLLKMVSSLAVVLALMMLAAAAARRWLRPGLAGGEPALPIRLASSLTLGNRRSVMVLEVAGRTLVVGATPQHLVLLTEFKHAAPAVKSSDNVRSEPTEHHGPPVHLRVTDAIRAHRMRVTARSQP